jgi:hypothetical protein
VAVVKAGQLIQTTSAINYVGTIADRIGMEDSDIANWASQIGQDIEDGKASGEDMQIALQLAKRYQEDLKQIMSNPDAAKELRVSAFGQRKDLYGKIKGESEEFESWVGNVGEDEVIEGEEELMQDEIAADEEGMDMTVETEEVEETAMDRVSARVAGRSSTVESESEIDEDNTFNSAIIGDFKRIMGDLEYFSGNEKDKQTWPMILNKAIELTKTSNDPRGLERQIKSMIERSVNMGDRSNGHVYDQISSAFMQRGDEMAGRTATHQSINAHQQAQKTESEVDECGCGDNDDGSMSPMAMTGQEETPQVAIMPLDDLQRILQIAGMR